MKPIALILGLALFAVMAPFMALGFVLAVARAGAETGYDAAIDTAEWMKNAYRNR